MKQPDQTLDNPEPYTFDRRFNFSRQTSFQNPKTPHTPVTIISNDVKKKHVLSRNSSKIEVFPAPKVFPKQVVEYNNRVWGDEEKFSGFSGFSGFGDWFKVVRLGSRQMKRLVMLIFLNVACSSGELVVGLVTGRVGLVSDAFHLTFGCGLLTFSLFAMAASRRKADRNYTYGYKRLEVLAAFTNTLFLLFMSFSLAVEALHAFVQDESEHKHYLIISAVLNLLVNVIGIWFFRNYARVSVVYRNAEDMNYHSICLHVVADSIRSAGLILASWLLSLGVENAEVLCLGLVSFTVFMLAMPLFKTSGGILLQEAPPSIHSSALTKCWRQVSSLEDVIEVSEARFWEYVPGHVVGSVSVQVKKGVNDQPVLGFVRDLYHDLGVQDFTVQLDAS
ncbi:cation efflux family protein [Artemisia annua]|uniref:Cation efflux family protein n=1 Tax=Artemisia annua TaxID=35608 RepID=A0A2U1LPA5_ARTAN|nr:cation efflux family protein [Artemisia annua]